MTPSLRASVHWVGFLLLTGVIACGDSNMTNEREPTLERMFSVLPDGSLAELELPGPELDKLESEVVAKLSDRVSPKYRQAVREFIENEATVGRATAVPDDEEMSRLLGRLYTIRDLRSTAQVVEAGRTIARSREAVVTVALVGSLDEPDVVARIRRTGGTRGRNVVFIPLNHLSRKNVAAALGVVSSLRQTDGDLPGRSKTVFLKAGAGRLHRSERFNGLAESVLASLQDQEGALEEFPGRGPVRVTTVRMPPE